MRDPRTASSILPSLGLALCLALACAGCGRLGEGQAERPTRPTEARFLPATPIDAFVGPSSIERAAADAAYAATQAARSAGANPPPGQDPTMAAAVIETVIAMATQGAASPTPIPIVDPGDVVGTPEPACAIPREPFRISLAPAAEADPSAAERWRQSRGWAFEAELQSLGETEPGAAGQARLQLTGAYADVLNADSVLPPAGEPLAAELPRELPAGLPLDLSYRGPPLPLEPGRRYLIAYDGDQAVGGSDGEGLLVADEQGLRLLAVSLREGDGADRRVLAGLRAGFEILQAPTTCRYVELHACGFELRAAPLEIGVDDRSQSLSAGEEARLELDRPYLIRVATSHFRLWRGDQPCEDPADWIRSYRIERAD